MRSSLIGLALSYVCLAQSQLPLKVSGPYQHSNLTVFLVHRDGKSSGGRMYMPLQEAIERKKVVVYETKNVNELAIENVSSDVDVYVQGGDVVKGGEQDRVFVTDLILPPKSGRTPIETFCVEQDRWEKRGREDAKTFQSSTEVVAHKELKRAVKTGKDQSKVWTEVARANQMAMEIAPGVVTSASSYQMNVERKEVTQKLDGYLKALVALPEKNRDAVGFVYAVNGKFEGGEQYASRELFAALWPKLLKAASVEASVAGRLPASQTFSVEEARRAIALRREGGKAESPNSRTKTRKVETGQAIVVESRDAASPESEWLHRSFVAK